MDVEECLCFLTSELVGKNITGENMTKKKKIKAVGTYRPISGEVHPVPTYSDEGIVKHNAAET